MKKKFVVMVLLLINVVGYGQKKRDNVIVIDTSISLSNLKMILFNNGYNPQVSDTIFLTTSPKQMKAAAAMKLMIVRTDTGIVLRGERIVQVEFMEIKNEFEPVFCWNIRGSLESDCWAELDRVAKILGSKRKYYKQ